MSWDILVMNSKKPVDLEKGDWPNFKSREFVIASIRQTFPDSNWQDPSWGILDNSKATIEFNVGDKENIDNSFMLHVRGGQDPTSEIAKLCKQHDWIAFDISCEKFIDNNKPIADSFKDWEKYRDDVISGTTKKKPWWKFKNLILILLFCLVFPPSNGQESTVPNSYAPIKEVYGDLNKDGIDEKVVVYNMTKSKDETEGIDREVIIFKKEKNEWVIWHRSTEAVGNSNDGGMMGDPFQYIEIIKGLLLIHQDGGSSWKWSNVDKYRFQNNRFELIGHTSYYGKPCEYWEEFDYNLMTGKIIFEKEYENCDDNTQSIYKRENETFTYKPKQRITFQNRSRFDCKIISPKYKHEIYL